MVAWAIRKILRKKASQRCEGNIPSAPTLNLCQHTDNIKTKKKMMFIDWEIDWVITCILPYCRDEHVNSPKPCRKLLLAALSIQTGHLEEHQPKPSRSSSIRYCLIRDTIFSFQLELELGVMEFKITNSGFLK